MHVGSTVVVVVVGVVVVVVVVGVVVVVVVVGVVVVVVVVGVVVVVVVVTGVPTTMVALLIVGLRGLPLASAKPESAEFKVMLSTLLLPPGLTALKTIVTKVPVPVGPPVPPNKASARFVMAPVVLLTVNGLLKAVP